MKQGNLAGFNGSPSMGRIGIVFEVSEEFFPLCFTRLLRKLADLGACFKVLSAVFR